MQIWNLIIKLSTQPSASINQYHEDSNDNLVNNINDMAKKSKSSSSKSKRGNKLRPSISDQLNLTKDENLNDADSNPPKDNDNSWSTLPNQPSSTSVTAQNLQTSSSSSTSKKSHDLIKLNESGNIKIILQHSKNLRDPKTHLESSLAFIEHSQSDELQSIMKLLSPNELKDTGNKLCAIGRYEDAIPYYTSAIIKNPSESVYYSNRALCYFKLGIWNQAISDCKNAIELDPNSLKAHFFLGESYAEQERFDEALRHLHRSQELAREQNLNFGDDIAFQIRLIKRRRCNKIEKSNEELEQELKPYLIDLMKRDRDAKLAALNESLQSNSSSSSNVDAKQARFDATTTEINSKYETYCEKLQSMFDMLDLHRQRRDVPDYLCGKISFEIMQDPVITPSGITYDRPDIEEHLKRVGHFDPVTRQPLKQDQMIPNLVMKEVIDAYLRENEWALYY